ncbi:MAG: aminoacylase [Betaproteobacteria bacterium]|nr:aminoacylase [Betaproteobacteria bacterium]
MLDCAIRGGTLVDGTGAPRVDADVGIRDGRVVAIGRITESARQEIDATGRVVAPGFIDVHTHYDAQIMWDPTLAPSSLHGVTTVLGGNCGFTIAPVDPSSEDYVMRMLACVEGIPIVSLQAALQFRWRSFGEWLSKLDGRVAINAGFLVGHSTIRRTVMGEDWRQAATEAQIDAMARHVDESVRDGALGFSSSWGEAHGDHLGGPVPSRFSTHEELVRLAGVLKKYPGTVLEFMPGITPRFRDIAVAVMGDMSAAAGRPLNWNTASVGTGIDRDALEARMSSYDKAAQRGGRVVALALPVPQPVRINLLMIGFNSLPGWGEIMMLAPEQQINAIRDPGTRAKMAAGLAGREHRHVFQFGNMILEHVESPALRPLVGRKLADIAAERGCTPLEVFLDTLAADCMRSYFVTGGDIGDDPDSWQLRAKIWDDPRAIVGASDAGAHVDSNAGFSYFTDLVGPSVRARKLLSLESAVRKLTDQPAQFYGLKGRGRIAPGYCADIVVFDPATIDSGKLELRNDMPGGERRLFSGAVGIDHVLVNGVETVTRGACTGALPGTVLRSGRDSGDLKN